MKQKLQSGKRQIEKQLSNFESELLNKIANLSRQKSS